MRSSKIARLRQHQVGAQILVLLRLAVLAMRDQRDRKAAVRLGGPHHQRLEAVGRLAAADREKCALLGQLGVVASVCR